MDTLTYHNETAETLAHATAIIGATSEEQQLFLGHLAISPFDTVSLDATTEGGIKDVRLLSTQLLLSPQFGPIRLGVIFTAEKLTPEAQNALLKLLEEPPHRVKIILFIQHDSSVLPTVLSRCRKYNAGSAQQTTHSITKDDALAQFLAAENIAKSDDLDQTVQAWLQYAYDTWCQQGRPSSSYDEVERLFHCYVSCQSQLNKRLIIEQLVVCSAL